METIRGKTQISPMLKMRLSPDRLRQMQRLMGMVEKLSFGPTAAPIFLVRLRHRAGMIQEMEVWLRLPASRLF